MFHEFRDKIFEPALTAQTFADKYASILDIWPKFKFYRTIFLLSLEEAQF